MTIDHVKQTMASLLVSTMEVDVYQLTVEGTAFIWEVTEVGGERHITASTNADQVPFPTLGAYSGDRKESKYGKTMMTPHYDACYRSFFGHGVSQNPQAEAASILNVRKPRSPFKIPPPVTTGHSVPPYIPNVPPALPTPGVPPANPSGSPPSATPGATTNPPAVDPTVADFWSNIQPSASSLQPGPTLFDLAGPHVLTPAKAQVQFEFLDLTVPEVQGLLMAAYHASNGQMQSNIQAVLQAVKGSLQAWTKGKMHSAISGVQNSVPGYDYHEVFSFILTQASLFYGKVGVFKVVSAG